jgi:hypothetical protein
MLTDCERNLICNVCEKRVPMSNVIFEGGLKDGITCPHCGMIDDFQVEYTSEEIKEAVREFEQMKKEHGV